MASVVIPVRPAPVAQVAEEAKASAVLVTAVSLADEVGLSDEDMRYTEALLRARLRGGLLGLAKMQLEVVKLWTADPLAVLAAARATTTDAPPRGLENPDIACFLNAAGQALLSSDAALLSVACAAVDQGRL